jgi:hypothetical protein
MEQTNATVTVEEVLESHSIIEFDLGGFSWAVV